jgi:hypothetical protein
MINRPFDRNLLPLQNLAENNKGCNIQLIGHTNNSPKTLIP